jgi:hypothetical protein
VASRHHDRHAPASRATYLRVQRLPARLCVSRLTQTASSACQGGNERRRSTKRPAASWCNHLPNRCSHVNSKHVAERLPAATTKLPAPPATAGQPAVQVQKTLTHHTGPPNAIAPRWPALHACFGSWWIERHSAAQPLEMASAPNQTQAAPELSYASAAQSTICGDGASTKGAPSCCASEQLQEHLQSTTRISTASDTLQEHRRFSCFSTTRRQRQQPRCACTPCRACRAKECTRNPQALHALHTLRRIRSPSERDTTHSRVRSSQVHGTP